MIFELLRFGLPVLHVLWWVWTDQRLRVLPRCRVWRGGLALLAGSLLAGYTALVIQRYVDVRIWIPAPLMSAIYLWFLLLLPLAYGWVILESIVRVAAAIRRNWPRRAPPAGGAPSIDSASPGSIARQTPAATVAVSGPSQTMPVHAPGQLSRRAVLAAGMSLAPPMLNFGAVGIALARLNDLRVRRFEVPLAALPPELDGLTIAHVSDLHVGRLVDGRLIRKVVDMTNSLRADLVVFTGDLIDQSLADLPAGLDMLRRLDPRSGLYVCEGNHDLFDDGARFESALRAASVGFLRDDATTVRVRGRAIQFIGMSWASHFDSTDNRTTRLRQWSGAARGLPAGFEAAQRDVAAVPTSEDPETFPILLAHHPHEFDSAADAGIPLTLAGHTHGGQLMLTPQIGAGPMLFRYWSGLYVREGRQVWSVGADQPGWHGSSAPGSRPTPGAANAGEDHACAEYGESGPPAAITGPRREDLACAEYSESTSPARRACLRGVPRKYATQATRPDGAAKGRVRLPRAEAGFESALIVSNGVGHWFPLRVNAPAEIVHITLRSVT